MSAREAAALGAERLDRRMPGWDQHIDLGILDVSHPARCAAGQAGAWWQSQRPWYALRRRWQERGLQHGWDVALVRLYDSVFPSCFLLAQEGFATVRIGTYPELTQAWRELIESRGQS